MQLLNRVNIPLPKTRSYIALQVYDTDNNILQAIDDLMIASLLTLGLQTAHAQLPSPSQALTITELGCGTGLNTSKLLLPPFTPSSPELGQVHIHTTNALDLSPAMLSIARTRCSSILSSQSTTFPSPKSNLTFHPFNALSPPPPPSPLSPAQQTSSSAPSCSNTSPSQHSSTPSKPFSNPTVAC
ncbi:hypothetical protein ONS95_004261 [Cadophora gregata]|uniref:uncharacterized protein n=1 Tax=Cadophora gregata TaxID=51156 RepID=UPI0026DACA88|nr:uncharacterized protein ONS95_004261 [Cadophora gregata]KAK0105363.1 hypothetical protein ONS96_004755 [Cadophora gregata f. sp. sojae]KAK0105741.1 hypothetical protein ONS95_004261 [Cadophora gregata]